MTTSQDRATRVIDKWQCDNTSYGTPEQLAQALADAGLLMPDLPGPMSTEEADRTGAYSSKRWKAYTTDGRGEHEETVYVDAYENEIYPCNSGDDLLDPESARALAYALLAAAAHATKEKK